MRLLPGMRVMGAYWDDINQLLFIKKLIEVDGDERIEIIQDTLANLPSYGSIYKKKPLTYSSLTSPENLVAVLFNIADYPIHAELVRKVGFKMGKGFQPLILRDPDTGAEIRDNENKPVPDSDFTKVRASFRKFTSDFAWNNPSHHTASLSTWKGARISNVLTHPNLDLKPRRLMPKALENLRAIRRGSHLILGEIADVLDSSIDLIDEFELSKLWRLVEGLDIRAIEGSIIPQYPAAGWDIAERKARRVYILQHKDIIIGLVRPERRNIGLLLDHKDDLIGNPDGIGVVRVKPEYQEKYPQEWLFAVLRSEACRLQFWTESGGTSYGKLTHEHVLSVLLPIPDAEQIRIEAAKVRQWSEAVEESYQIWNEIGFEEDRVPIINSFIYGLDSADD